MEKLMARIGGDLDRLIRKKDRLQRENQILRRENERLREILSETVDQRDDLNQRVERATRKVETALTRLNVLADDI